MIPEKPKPIISQSEEETRKIFYSSMLYSLALQPEPVWVAKHHSSDVVQAMFIFLRIPTQSQGDNSNFS